ncbi:chorismate--pyruvate lyase family protein [Piscirickettsia salmonis]|uniref:chorismate--pyruvate lyase family protein n=1 Tax=Piscirickettsia salmonis TaxID=1238 RepID=UPI0012BB1504|nr:chorismate lyase [Piscirickettsia salmonis]QGP53667.1 chorismate pyruvate lyase [Piscirickettsia salmonis]QGP60426.1 chorismate pyruvate lyase [Piscirickettsia salmonis]QGP63233.1 chorismate pyruvate lyase [Piscirickettsia salmonis]
MSVQPIVWQHNATVIGASCLYQPWLERPYCLTSAIKRATCRFSVRVLSESSKPLQALYQSDDIIYQENQVWEREVYLCGDNTPWVYASVVFSSAHPPEILTTLGSRPLGETLFFHPDGRDVARSKMEYAGIDRSCDVYLPAFDLSSQDRLYARRSVFSPYWGQVLVTEIFLDTLPDYPLEERTLRV